MTEVLPAVRHVGNTVPAADETWPSREAPRKLQPTRRHNEGT